MSAVEYDAVRDILADEIADVGAGCIARVARTASTPLAWRMVRMDICRWQHPALTHSYGATLAVAAKRMEAGDPAAALGMLLDHWGEGEELALVEVVSEDETADVAVAA